MSDHRSEIKLVKSKVLSQQSVVFTYFKVLPSVGRQLGFQVWSFFSRSKSLKLASVTHYFPWFNYLKVFLVKNKGNSSRIYLLDDALVSTKLVTKFFYMLRQALSLQMRSQLAGWCYTLNFVGLGYKVFLYRGFLYLKLGFCRIIKVKVPSDVSIFARKRNRLLLLSNNHDALSRFVVGLKKLRKFDLYKGKGIFEYSNFDGIKLKVGKQQQFY